MRTRLSALIVTTCLLAPFIITTASAASRTPAAQYVLSNPHSKCRTHYVKRTIHISKRVQIVEHGVSQTTVVTVRAVGCVLVTSLPTPLYGLTIDDISNITQV